MVHFQLGRLDEARDDLVRALSLDGDTARAHYHLAWVWHKLGDTAKALQHVRETLRLSPDHEDAKALEAELQRSPRIPKS